MRNVIATALLSQVVFAAPIAAEDWVCEYPRSYMNAPPRDGALSPRHKHAVFQIRASGPDGPTATAFLITEDLALTAAHAVTRENDSQFEKIEQIEAYFHGPSGPQTGTAEVLAFEPKTSSNGDIALLKITYSSPAMRHGLPLHLDRFPVLTPGRVRAFGYGEIDFATRAARPREAEFDHSTGEVSYRSLFGDSGAPVVSLETGHTIGMHLGKMQDFDARNYRKAPELAQFLFEHFPNDIVKYYVETLRATPVAKLAEMLKPDECNVHGMCWEDTELAIIAARLRQDVDLRAGLDREIFLCPLLLAARARGMYDAFSDFDVVAGRRQADGTPTQSAIDAAREVVDRAFTQPFPDGAEDKVILATQLADAEILLADAAAVSLARSWPAPAGRLCSTPFETSARYAMSELMAATGSADRVASVAVAAETPLADISCDMQVANEVAAVLYFDAATAAKERAALLTAAPEVGFNVGGIATSRAPIYYAATASLSGNPRREYEAWRGLALTAQEAAPDLAATGALAAFKLNINPESDAADYEFLRGQVSNDIPEASFLPPASIVRNVSPAQALEELGTSSRHVLPRSLGVFR